MAKLSEKGLALSFGVTCAICVLLLGLAAWLLSWGVVWVDLIGNVYIGYQATLLGALIGAVYAFVDGLIGGYLIAYFYNKFQ